MNVATLQVPHDVTQSKDYGIADLRVASSPWTVDIRPEIAQMLLAHEKTAATQRPDFAGFRSFKLERSMLHIDVLILMRYLAAVTEGPIVEFGPYIGGSTVSFAKGITLPRKFMVLEPGGSSTHPHIPSKDIYGDLEHNLESQGVRDRVTLFQTSSWKEEALPLLTDALKGEKISLLCIDSDGYVGRDLGLYEHLCTPGCVLIIDDFIDTGTDNCQKSNDTQPYILDRVANGSLVQFGIYGWSTWIGRFPA